MSGGGGGYAYKRERRADQYVLLYTIHFKIPSAPPTAELKGAFHERCYVYILSDMEAHCAIFTRLKQK
jgi:hypothetical protein